VYYRLHMRT